VISGVVWLATLLALLLDWVVDTHRVHYPEMDPGQNIAYISDVAAARLKPLFIVGCCLTTIFLDISFGLDRWLRHKGWLVPNSTRGEKILSGLTIGFAFIGTIGLCFLSGFDVRHYKSLHDTFLLLFIGGYLLSAIFICWEYQRLGISKFTFSSPQPREPRTDPGYPGHREHRILRISFWIKLAFVCIELCLSIGFVCTNFSNHTNPAAGLEWTIAFIFSFYVFSFVVDLYPASRRETDLTATPRQMEEHKRDAHMDVSSNGTH
jgi:hypothetical protein